MGVEFPETLALEPGFCEQPVQARQAVAAEMPAPDLGLEGIQ